MSGSKHNQSRAAMKRAEKDKKRLLSWYLTFCGQTRLFQAKNKILHAEVEGSQSKEGLVQCSKTLNRPPFPEDIKVF